MRRKRKGARRTARRARLEAWLFAGLPLILGGCQIFWRYPSSFGLYLFQFPACLLMPLALAACLMALRARSPSLIALSALSFGWLVGPTMGYAHGGAPPRAEGRRLRIVSCNAESWSGNLTAKAKAIAALEPDVILFQEMWWLSHLDDLKRELPHFLFRGDDGGYDGTVIGSRLPLAGSPFPPPSNALANVLEVDGRSILLVTVHGRKKSGFATADFEDTIGLQKAQGAELRSYIEAHHLPVILGGDLNSPPQGALPESLHAYLQDVFPLAGRGYGYTFPSAFPVMRIDAVMVSPHLGTVTRCQTVDVGSDHRALVVDLRLDDRP